MHKEEKQLSIPENALNDPESFEILRVWIANKEQHCSIKVETWNDPAAWGIFCADLARIVAQSYNCTSEEEYLNTIKRIVMAFDAEISSPTDIPFSNSSEV